MGAAHLHGGGRALWSDLICDPAAFKMLKLQSVDLTRLFWAAVTLITVNSTPERRYGSENHGQAKVK